MIITKTPFRISFAGGGTDLADYYTREAGAVLSTTIDKYVYIALHDYFEKKIVLKYSKTEMVDRVDQIQHPLIRECLRMAEMNKPVEITSFADIPATGSGLGSSSAFAVGLLKALHTFQGRNLSPQTCASMACEVEIDRLKEPIGKQDQFAAAFGGLNFIKFNQDGTVAVEPVVLPREKRELLESHLLMFYTGITRKATSILTEQKKNSVSKIEVLRSMRDLASQLNGELGAGNVAAMGSILHEGWLLKREMASGISSGEIDLWYERARKCGAEGGKLLGAGGGGFLLFYCSPTKQAGLIAELKELRHVPFRFEPQGTRIIYAEG